MVPESSNFLKVPKPRLTRAGAGFLVCCLRRVVILLIVLLRTFTAVVGDPEWVLHR